MTMYYFVFDPTNFMTNFSVLLCDRECLACGQMIFVEFIWKTHIDYLITAFQVILKTLSRLGFMQQQSDVRNICLTVCINKATG